MKVTVSPAWYDDYVLTVGSVGPSGAPSQFSLAGPWVDVAAPGEEIVSLDPDGEGLVDTLPAVGEAMPISGTSYAAPGERCRGGACTVAVSDRAASHAAHRRHRPPAGRRMGSS